MSTQNLDNGCPPTSTAKKKAAKDRKRCSIRKGKLRKMHSTSTIRAGKPTIPPKPRLLSSGRSIVQADSQASLSKPGKPAIAPKPCLSKSKAERPTIAPKPRMPAWESGRPIIQPKPQIPSQAPEGDMRPMPTVTQMCPIAVLTPMGFLIPRNFPSAILMNQAVTLAGDEQIHPDDPVQAASSDPVAQTHDTNKCTNDIDISNELLRQLTDLFTSMCQIQDSSEAADHIEEEDFSILNVFRHTKDFAVTQNSKLALALRNILLEVQVIQSEAPEMMKMLGKKNGRKEYKRGGRSISARCDTANKAGESNKLLHPSKVSRVDTYRKHFAQHTDTSYRSESPKPWKFNLSKSSAKTAQKTEHEVADTAKALKETASMEKKREGIKSTDNEKANCTPKKPCSEKQSSEESRTNWKDMGSSVAEKIMSFSQIIQERTHDAVEANTRMSNSKITCSNVIGRKDSNQSNGSMHRLPGNEKFREKEKEEKHFASFLNNNLTFKSADPPLHDGDIEKSPRSLKPESEVRVKRDKIQKLVGKGECQKCSESKQASGKSTEASSKDLPTESHEVHEKTRAVVEDLKRRLANTQGSTTAMTQERVTDIWDSFSTSSSLDDEHIYEEIDEMTEVFGTNTDEDLSLHNKFSAVSNSKNMLAIEEEVLVKTTELTTASTNSPAQASSHEAQEAVMNGEAVKSEIKVQEERRDAKGGLRSVIKGKNADATTKNKEKQSTSTSHQSDTNLDNSSEDEESENFCFVIGF